MFPACAGKNLKYVYVGSGRDALPKDDTQAKEGLHAGAG